MAERAAVVGNRSHCAKGYFSAGHVSVGDVNPWTRHHGLEKVAAALSDVIGKLGKIRGSAIKKEAKGMPI